MSRDLPVVLPRTCGDCSACCTAVPVQDDVVGIDKPGHERCAYQARRGCSIYEHRPRACAVYTCMWIAGWGRLSDRPDRLGLVVETLQRSLPTVAIVTEVWPRAREGKRARQLLAALLHQLPTIIVHRLAHPPVVIGEMPALEDLQRLAEEMAS